MAAIDIATFLAIGNTIVLLRGWFLEYISLHTAGAG